MAYERTASGQPVNMSLNPGLVRQARDLTSNLPKTVQTLLGRFVADADAKAAEQERQIAASETIVASHGSLAEEFDAL